MSGSLSANVSQALQVYIAGTKAWFEDSNEAWVSATVISKEETPKSVKILFENDQDSSKQHTFESSFADLEQQKGANLPPLKNPPQKDTIDDLTSLTFLNEPSVLDTIRARYLEKKIYTYSGIVLIAANPFARVPLYEPEVIQMYSGKRRGELEPHLFAIAEDAYRFMIREKMNQTVVVSGESGAGKTVSATHIMRFFATADDQESGKVKDASQGMTEVEKQIMATNPIMEAFGNAKTTRNNNSSRFGKYIEIQFDNGNNIVGAKIRTYLLERSRLNFQPETERNYHIFYQVNKEKKKKIDIKCRLNSPLDTSKLCLGLPSEEKSKLGLSNWNDFYYLNQSGTGSIPGVDDAAEFGLTQESLALVGIHDEQQREVFQLLAALLYIGNIQIGGRSDASVADDDPALLKATQLLGIQKTSEFKKWLTRRQIITRSDKIVKNLSIVQSIVVRDSVAKYIYASLFDWLVKVVNDSLSCQEEGKVRTFIGVLDIYGFEHFKKNSFEQFCINYANEKLQQQFNQHVFKLEQEEYIKEKIEWRFIEFSDNQKCIEVIESKLGILSLLDEESRMPSGTDQGFCNKLFSSFTDPKYKEYFKKPRFSNSSFTVCHYAHEVEYDSEGFLDKNKDTVPDELLNLLQTAQSSFLVEMLQTATAAAMSQEVKSSPPKKPGMAVAKKPTLGSIFKLSLISLMDTINKTNVHYIRCIKPNEAKEAWGFEANMVLSQLRACGVLETIRISCLGYPSRWEFQDFVDRFYALIPSKHWFKCKNPDIRELCGLILKASITDKDKYQVGLTKLFFRAGQLAYLEKCRREEWDRCTILIQKNAKRFLARRRYLQALDFVWRLQRVARQKMGLLRLEMARETKAAIRIQTAWRRWIQRQRYLNQCRLIIKLQSQLKGWRLRRQFLARRQHTVRLQACIRSRLAQKKLAFYKEQGKAPVEPKPAPPARAVESVPKKMAPLEDLETQVNTWMNQSQVEKKSQPVSVLIPSQVGEEEDTEVAELKSQILALKSQLSMTFKKYSPPRAERAEQRVPRAMKKSSQQKKIVFAQAEHMVPKQDRLEQPSESTVARILQTETESLAKEITELIQTVRVVPAGRGSREQVFFSVHLVSQSIAHSWGLGFFTESERLISAVAQAIEMECASFVEQEAFVPCTYWLSNTHELLSLLCSMKIRSVPTRSLEKIKSELEQLEEMIYCRVMMALKKELDPMVVPAMIESQGFPGFKDNDRFESIHELRAEDVVGFLDQAYQTMQGYFLEAGVIEQGMSELLRLIGISAFNDLIMRRHFNSWKRGMQIQHNISCLEFWCQNHALGHVTQPLEPLAQAVKLLQLRKETMQDIQAIYDICWTLSPAQIQKLIQDYHTTGYEEPMGQDILRAVGSRVTQTSSVILDSNLLDRCDYDIPEPYQVNINSYIPDYLNLQRVPKVIMLNSI